MPFILRVTAHEVVVEVVATDRHNRPVNNLQEGDFQVFETGKRSRKTLRSISAFHVIDPSLPNSPVTEPSGGFRVSSVESCAIGRQSHYEIAYQPSPDGWTGGYHEILVTTSRPKTELVYRHRYYVGETRELAKPQLPSDTKAEASLQQAACFHPETPPSISLLARLVQAGSADSLRYSLEVQADSLAFIALSDEAKRVQLDYGICTFDSEGIPLNFMHASIERKLTALEYQRALVGGYPKQLEFPKQGNPALVRFAVRDRVTGNMGTVSVPVTSPVRDVANTGEQDTERARESRAAAYRSGPDYIVEPNGPIRSFGTILPRSDSLCGDVYEIPETTLALPDFWTLDPIGALYTDELDVPPQHVENLNGLPGVTNRVEWFAIDYYGDFWIAAPGEYTFQLFSDDGARLYIDDNLLIDQDGIHSLMNHEERITLNAGRHSLHLPYLQGPGYGVALVLLVKPPGGEYRVFDVRDFSPPAKAK
jgi:hypothetical protein